MHPLGNVNSLSGQLQLPLPKEDDCSFWQLSVKVRTKKDYAPMLRETRESDGFLNRPKLASLKHRRFLTEAAPPPACGPSPSRNGAGERSTRNGKWTQRLFAAIFRLPLPRSPRPFLEKAVPQDGKLVACVKKSRCLSAASLGILASYRFPKAFVRPGPRLFGYFLGNAKSNNQGLLV
jgi:hypothetical protein